jgi:hypothetical protein
MFIFILQIILYIYSFFVSNENIILLLFNIIFVFMSFINKLSFLLIKLFLGLSLSLLILNPNSFSTSVFTPLKKLLYISFISYFFVLIFLGSSYRTSALFSLM